MQPKPFQNYHHPRKFPYPLPIKKSLVVRHLVLWKCFEYQPIVFYPLQQVASFLPILLIVFAPFPLSFLFWKVSHLQKSCRNSSMNSCETIQILKLTISHISFIFLFFLPQTHIHAFSFYFKHTHQQCKILIFHIMILSWEIRAGFPKWSKNSLREQEKGDWLGFYCDQRVEVGWGWPCICWGLHELNFLPKPRRKLSGLLAYLDVGWKEMWQ